MALAGKIAFEVKDRGFHVRASYEGSPNVEIVRAGQLFRTFDFEAYRIWNIAAHFGDWVDDWLYQDELAWREVDRVIQTAVKQETRRRCA